PLLTFLEERELARRKDVGDEAAKRRLIECNLRLVMSITQGESAAGASETRAEQARRPEARIYVASLADYNAGRLHGAWINAVQEPERIQAEIATMLERSHEPLAEEWAIHDYEGFTGIRLSEYESIERISQIANGIAEYG